MESWHYLPHKRHLSIPKQISQKCVFFTSALNLLLTSRIQWDFTISIIQQLEKCKQILSWSCKNSLHNHCPQIGDLCQKRPRRFFWEKPCHQSCHQRLSSKTAQVKLSLPLSSNTFQVAMPSEPAQWGQGVPRAHTLESQVHTGTILHHFSTQNHPRTQTGVTCAHSHFPESPAAHRLGTILHHFFHPESPAHTWHGIGWGGVAMMTFFCTCTHVQSVAQWTCFGTYFTRVQTCNVTRVQSATEWTASVHTLHMSKPVM